MGNIFRRRRQVTEELDEITNHLKELEEQLNGHIEGRSDFLRMLLYTAFTLFTASSGYFWLKYRAVGHRILAICGSFFGFVVLFFVLRYLLITFYDFLIHRKRRRIQYYTDRKILIIEDVKENEKFKVAKEIIEKYSTKEELDALSLFPQNDVNSEKKASISSERSGPLAVNSEQQPLLGSNAHPHKASTQSLRTPLRPQSSASSLAPRGSVARAHSATRTPMPKLHEMSNAQFAPTPVRPFVEQSHNPLDRILDYVMGESINNRYALVCEQCKTHNGMALREEFEQISYFCFKCGRYNPSRNERRMANAAAATVASASRHSRSGASVVSATALTAKTATMTDTDDGGSSGSLVTAKSKRRTALFDGGHETPGGAEPRGGVGTASCSSSSSENVSSTDSDVSAGARKARTTATD